MKRSSQPRQDDLDPKRRKLAPSTSTSIAIDEEVNLNSCFDGEQIFCSILSYCELSESLYNLMLISKSSFHAIHKFIKCLHLNSSNFPSIEKMLAQTNSARKFFSSLQKFENLEELHLDGFDELKDSSLDILCASFPSFIRKLHIRDCNNLSHLNLKNLENLESIQLSLLVKLDSISFQNLSSLHTLQFFDCAIPPTVKLGVEQLQTLLFHGCTKLTDMSLSRLLRQFDSSQYSVTEVSSSPPVVTPSINSDLKKLEIIECSPLHNPFISVESLEELRIVNCNSLNNPFIRCINLKELHMKYCVNLLNLTIGCDNIKKIDFTGSGFHSNHQFPVMELSAPTINLKEKIIQNLKNHYGAVLDIVY